MVTKVLPISPDSRQHSFFLFSFSFISLIADEPHHYHPACGHKGSSPLSPAHALQFFIAMQVQHSYYNLSTNGWILFTHVPTLSVTKERTQKSYFGKNRTHDFRTSRCAAYLLDHSGDKHLANQKFNDWILLTPVLKHCATTATRLTNKNPDLLKNTV